MLKIHYYTTLDPAYEKQVSAILGTDYSFTTGKELPTDTQVLLLGYPTPEQLASCPALRYILIPFAGVPRRTRELLPNYPHIKVLNIHHNAPVVAEMVVGFIFTLSKHIIKADREFRTHDWSFRYGHNPSSLLWNKKVLICGYGSIGHFVEKFLAPYHMQIDKIKQSGISPTEGVYPLADLPTIIGDYDFVLNFLPDTTDTMKVFNSEVFTAMKPTAFFINPGRASTVEEESFYNALKYKQIAGAAVDVWYNYPKSTAERTNLNPANFPFHELDNIIISPHRAGGLGMPENEKFRTEEIIKTLINIHDNNPLPNIVNLQNGY